VRRFIFSITISAALLLSLPLQADLPTPLINLKFSESGGTTTTNSGSLSGDATLDQPDGSGLPAFTNLAPTGLYTPAGNASAVDFGLITAGQFGRAVDLPASLGPLTQFTVCGWLNARDLTVGPGGNRLAFALDGPNGNGFDLVQLANGSLRIGINQWPDGANGGGPSSSAGVLRADPQAGPTNWVFFAVTYNSTLPSGNLKYYFGNPQALANLDSTHNYTGLFIGLNGELVATGPLTLGNFGWSVSARPDPGPNSRGFRGLIDELRVFDQAIDLAGIQEAQLNGAPPPVAATILRQPSSVTVYAGNPATFRVQASGTAPFTYQWQRNGVDLLNATDESYTVGSATLGDHSATFRAKVSNPVVSNVLSDPAILTVLADVGPRVFLSFSESGLVVTNRGNLMGGGVYAATDGYPSPTAKVPTGAFAPTDNISSVDFGDIAIAQGGRAIDVTNQFDGTVGPMTGFTVSGWLNCRNLTEGYGGNRIAFALASPGGPGFDLVQLANGSLRLGVNEWPDANPGVPASSEQKINPDPLNGATNWVFFAVTYDSALPGANVSYYFGAPDQPAVLDNAADYLKGPVPTSGPLTIGNFSGRVSARTDLGPGGGSRCFRGLIDEIHLFGKALTLSEIQAVQKSPAYKPVVLEPVTITQNPQTQTVFAGQRASFRVTASGTPPMGYQWWRRHAGTDSAISDATSPNLTTANLSLSDNGDAFWVVVSNAVNQVVAPVAVVTVLPENNHKVFLSFSEGLGTNTVNAGNIGGAAVLVQSNGFPAFSTNVPVGTFTPGHNTSSIDYGLIAEGQGGRALDLTGTITPTLGSMTGFSVTGWLNSRDLSYGWGGNRILYCQAGLGAGGFDLVQEAGGVLWMGVNSWPDWPLPVSTAKSSPRLTADPEAGNANWVFFAVTYDGTAPIANANFYFGSPTETAALDTTADYDKGAVESIGLLAVGNFSPLDQGARNGTGSQNSRCFRGLIDEIQVYNRVLTLTEIQAAQTLSPATVPTLLSVARQANQVVISWSASANFQLQYATALGSGTWNDEWTSPVSNGMHKTVTLPATASARFYRLMAR
jgi:hypothetical protein